MWLHLGCRPSSRGLNFLAVKYMSLQCSQELHKAFEVFGIGQDATGQQGRSHKSFVSVFLVFHFCGSFQNRNLPL